MLRFIDIDRQEVATLLNRFQLELCVVGDNQAIPGSYWGDEEAGLIGNRLYLRADTPLHSILHESCHYICMDSQRRKNLHTNAEGDTDEENAVCYLQVLLADSLSSTNRNQLFTDMDAWGYSFRLGSSKSWFERDADDARDWLLDNELVDEQLHLLFRLR